MCAVLVDEEAGKRSVGRVEVKMRRGGTRRVLVAPLGRFARRRIGSANCDEKTVLIALKFVNGFRQIAAAALVEGIGSQVKGKKEKASCRGGIRDCV